jgi:hypothetical protein
MRGGHYNPRHATIALLLLLAQKYARAIFVPNGAVHAAEELPADAAVTPFDLK